MRTILIATILSLLAASPAIAEDRALVLRHTHTGKSETIVFKRDGRFDETGLAKVNAFLADWRNGKQTRMDPALLDLIWQIYQDVGASQPIQIVSSYRSPETNEMLRSTSSGVAENSQHTHGRAMDFFIPGVPLDVLRAAAMRRQGGGVGYYPASGSPFVHVDTGSVRAWPRMTTAQLKTIFPDGRTAHLPSDGPPLAQVQVAQASLAATPVGPAAVERPRTLMGMLFGDGKETRPTLVAQPPSVEKQEDRLEPTSSALMVAEPTIQPPMPVPRPPDLYAPVAVVASAPVPRPRPRSGIEVRVVDEPYAPTVLGYAASGPLPASAASPAIDPFAFVHDIPMGTASPKIVDMPEGMLVGHAASSAAFATFTPPEMSSISTLVAPSEDEPMGSFSHPTRRF